MWGCCFTILRNPAIHQRFLEELGPRICIMGPSNSGKSTLAEAIGRAQNWPVVHLDQLYHLPNTDWQPRLEAEFIALHDGAILAPQWLMDGNYSACLPQRLKRATGFILLDVSTATSLWRYLRRSWFRRDSVKWVMIHHIIITTRLNRGRYKLLFERISLSKLALTSDAGIGTLVPFRKTRPVASPRRRPTSVVACKHDIVAG